MFLHFSFSTLLASLLFAVLTQDAHAAPLLHRQPKGMISIPLKRIEARGDMHPQILLQQHINRSKKRLALMSGHAQPSDHELRQSITKRMFLLSNGPVPSSTNVTTTEKRFNHAGTHRNEGGNKKRFNHSGTHRQDRRQLGGVSLGDGRGDDSESRGQGRNNRQNGQQQQQKQQQQGAPMTVTVTVIAGAQPTPVTGDVKNETAAETNEAAGKAKGTNAAQNPGLTKAEINALKNGGSTAPETPTGENSLGLEIFANDVGYFADVQIGTPPQTFKILMDSGSADFWVGAEKCVSTGGGNCGDKTFLGAQGSSSFVDTGADFQVTYGTGAVAGSKITDNVVLAGLKLNKLAFGVAEQETPEFSGDAVEFDGLMGTAQSILANQKVLTPVEKLKADGLIQQAITSYKLGRLADGKNDGQITFGGLDDTRFDAASLVEVDNVSQVGFWEAEMDAVAVDGVDAGLQGRKAILDTGTTLILAPEADAIKLHQGIEGAQSDGQGGFIVPCTTQAVITLTFGGKEFSIDPRDLAFAPVDINDPTGACISGISAGNVGDATEWLVGDTFLKSVYFSHNVDTNTMSLANLK